MPGILIKNVPNALHEQLKRRAAANRRSLSNEALTILEEGLAEGAGPPPLAEVDRLRVRGRQPLTQSVIDSARESGRP